MILESFRVWDFNPVRTSPSPARWKIAKQRENIVSPAFYSESRGLSPKPKKAQGLPAPSSGAGEAGTPGGAGSW